MISQSGAIGSPTENSLRLSDDVNRTDEPVVKTSTVSFDLVHQL
jgi:hypothetical protein